LAAGQYRSQFAAWPDQKGSVEGDFLTPTALALLENPENRRRKPDRALIYRAIPWPELIWPIE
jgi:hypothetical protein